MKFLSALLNDRRAWQGKSYAFLALKIQNPKKERLPKTFNGENWPLNGIKDYLEGLIDVPEVPHIPKVQHIPYAPFTKSLPNEKKEAFKFEINP